MGLRPSKCYSKFEKAYTRASRKKPRKSYVKAVPASKIHVFELGKPKPEFDLRLRLIAKGDAQIRHNALEAARVATNKALEKELGKECYFLKILVYPHHILRENPIATGAGADRFQTGMRLSFGKPISIAARVRKGQSILEIRVEHDKEKVGKKALKIASSKIPVPTKIVVQ